MPDAPCAFSELKTTRLEEKVGQKKKIGRREIKTLNDLKLDRQENDIQRQQEWHSPAAGTVLKACGKVIACLRSHYSWTGCRDRSVRGDGISASCPRRIGV